MKNTLIVCWIFLFLPYYSFADQFKVTQILDGDTIILENDERVRLIGVDTTEKSHPLKPIEYFSEEATQFTKQLLHNKIVRLEYDEVRRGKYGRLLAYVYLEDDTFVNAEIIKQGYGFAYTKYPFKYKEEFVSLEKEAKENKRGYWRLGGRGELKWLLNREQQPFKIYQMSQKMWGIGCNGFIITRVKDEELIAVVNNLRQWINEFHDKDLEEQLLKSGWERGDWK